MSLRFVAAAIVLAAGVSAPLRVTTAPQLPPLVPKSTAGGDLYRFYCASCHGRDGRGAGPTAAALKQAPSDLTAIAAKHGGVFPRDDVAAFISWSGTRPVTAHGSSEMPVWGPIFIALDPSAPMTRVRIANVVDYLASIQTRTATPK